MTPVPSVGQEDTAAVSSEPPVQIVATPQPSPKKVLKAVAKDFFGRPIAPKAATTNVVKKTLVKAVKQEGSEHSVTPTKKVLPPTHPVKYVFFDGSTNAVKMPATLSDF